MSLYGRARPTRFDELVGQDHVRDLLAVAVRRDVVSHAYLFSGPRGVGKTTSARLLAMAVNCDEPDAAMRPCGRCESCTLVQRGAHPDVHELDAASNNSVDDVRELREQVALSPLRGGRRAWILDEAHMLSRAAANALLKTLEEPPPRTLFVLATTESEKLPPTVVSRCQHFRFRRLSDDEILGKLERLAEAAGIEAERDALALVARTADGAMRDAESLLERLLGTGGAIDRASVEEALGLPASERLGALAQSLARGDLANLLAGAASLYRDGFAPRTVANGLARTLRDALVEHVATGASALDLDQAALVRALHALDEGEERFVRRGDLYALEIALLRARSAIEGTLGAAAAPAAAAAPSAGASAPVRSAPLEPQPRSVDATAAPTADQAPAPPTPPADREPPAESEPPPSAARRARTGAAAAERPFSWHAALALAKGQLKAFLLPAEATFDGGALHLRYSDRHAFHFSQLARREDELYELLERAGAGSIDVHVDGPGGRLRRAAGNDPGKAPRGR